MSTVGQQNTAQLFGGLGAVNGAAEALLDELGQEAAVVYMGVREHDGVDVARVEKKLFFIECFDQLGALEHAAVHQHFLFAYFNQIAGAGYGARSA